MKPREFTLNNLITFPFTANRVAEIAGVLRNVGLFPKSHKHDYYTNVTINEAVLFLYLVASETPSKHVKVNIEMLLQLLDSKGKSFYDDFCKILSDPEELKRVKNIEIGTQIRFVTINFNSGESSTYNSFNMENMVQKLVRLPFSFLAEFAIALYSEEAPYVKNESSLSTQLDESFNKIPKNVLVEKPTLSVLKKVTIEWDRVYSDKEED